MSTVVPTLVRVGRQGNSRLAIVTKTAQVAVTSQRRSTSWIAWELPNPALYAPPPGATPSNETQQAASKIQDTRSVGKTVTAPSTVAVAGGSQEVSVSGKTVPLSIKAGSTRIPSGQTRSVQTQSRPHEGVDGWMLPTTLIRIPKMTSTWPDEKPVHPDQKRVRKYYEVQALRKSGDTQSKQSATTLNRRNSLDGKASTLLRTISSVLFGLQALKEFPESSYPSVSFRQAILTYMDGVHSREEAAAAVKDLEEALRSVNELEKEDPEEKEASGDKDSDKGNDGKEQA
ncbi:hypothetical protein F4818DRAFT_456812 [Hypoxylon cercidicola]|nr:hypothetical protein F4818DRAFT_456812 [Hypoxylon cercidicola]